MAEYAPRFTWIPFYEELADKLLEYRHKRKELVDIVYSLPPEYVDYLKYNKDQKLTDIDPFSIFGIFNRGISSRSIKESWEKRFEICKIMKECFNLHSELPRDFWGIPVAMNWNANFSYQHNVGEIDVLWNLFISAIKFKNIAPYFDSARKQKGKKWNLTMILYWIRPKQFMPLDNPSKVFLNNVGIRVFQEKDLNAENYLKLMDEIKKSNHPKIKGLDFPTISFEAWTEKNNQSKSEQNAIQDHNVTHLELATKLLELHKNIILQGAPGTGKTYSTAEIALGVIDEEFQDHDQVMERYEELQKEGSIFFTTFHQSMDYEDFVEGLKPEVVEDGNGVEYVVTDGIFKQVCQAAEEDERPVVLIIDEINRGNVLKIFGELITLLEKDKRIGGDHPIRVTLPYSGESFGVPSNVYIIGTMNTTDRSTGTLDYALRRRFSFVTLKADKDVIQNPKGRELFEDVERFVRDFQTGEIELDDLMIGHSYFMTENKDDDEELKLKIEYEVIPLLKEYVKDGLLNCRREDMEAYFEAWRNLQTKPAQKDEDGINP